MDSQTDSVYLPQTQSNSAPTLQDAIRKLETSNINSVSFKSQSNLAPTFPAVRGLIGSQLETITDTDQELSSQPNLYPPTYRDVRNINNVDSSNTTRPVFFQQPPLNNTRQADVSVAASPVFENFKKEVENLKIMKRQVQEKIGIARDDKSDNLLSGVEEWLKKAGDEISKAEELLEQEATAKKRFFEEFDQLATMMTPCLLEHKESGKDFVTRVSVFENRGINVAPRKLVIHALFVLAKKKIGYTRNSSENVEKLRHEAEELKVMMWRVQQLINISTSKGELLLYGVEDWVKKAGYEISKVDKFLEEEANAKKKWGKIGLCGNWGTLHRYGKIATEMAPSLLQLQERGNTYASGNSIGILPPTPLDAYQTKNLEDLATHNSALDAIITALEDESKQIIGIYGLGGVGKTTLAMEVAARVKKTNLLFVEVAFTFVSQTVDAVKIQKDLENATKRIMEGDKILIILDDVWEKLNLEELLIPCGSNNMNCKILLTSRDEKVCRGMNAQSIIYVHSLPTQEAWLLFKRVVGERVQTDVDLKPIAEEVAKECGGLPLLIQVVANALKDESIHSWKAALSQLKKHAAWEIDPDIRKAFNQLMLSYDYLKSQEAKVCFLLCGLFHEVEDIELEELVRYVVGLELFGKLESIEIARDRVQKAVNMLTSSCLLLNVEDDRGCTKMHSVVRDLALLIGSKGKNKYLLKAGKDLTEWLPRDNSVKHLADYQTNFDDFLGSYGSMIRMLDKKALLRALSKATNHYHDRYIIKDGETGKVYKGKLSRNGQLMYFAVRRSNRQYGENYIDFERELEILSNFKHENIGSIFKYFDEDDENIIIYEPTFHGSLQENLSNPALTWSRRLQICLGVARALNYIHNRGLIHCNINSSNILLDEDWNPKIFGFELCTEYPQSWTRRLKLSRYLGITSVMTPNYDVQLFGELLIEVLCNKKPVLAEGGFNEKEVDDNIDPSLKKHIKSETMNYFKNIAYNCLDKKLVEPPSMTQIVKDLEEAELLRQQEDLERSSNGDEDASRDRLQIYKKGCSRASNKYTPRSILAHFLPMDPPPSISTAVRKPPESIYTKYTPRVPGRPPLKRPSFSRVRNMGGSLYEPPLDPPSLGDVKFDFYSAGQAEKNREIAMADMVAASPVIENFKDEVESLKVMKRQVQEKFGIARDKGDNLLSGVEEWLNKAGDEISKAEELLEQEANTRKRWFEEYEHYDNKATKMAPFITEHQVCGTDFVTSVSVDETPTPGFLDDYQNQDRDDIVIHNSALNNIIAALEDDDTQIIGIYGLGGVGKTTLAMEAAARVKNSNVVFITVSRTGNAKMIKKDLENTTKRIVKGDKVLIILDDVWEKLDLEDLCIPINHTNCKILLTSRSEDVCEKMNAQSKICVSSLPKEEAWLLFTRVVGERLEMDSHLKPVALEVVKECGGLPLLIQALGNALKYKGVNSWNSALSRLQKRAPSEIDPDIRKVFTHLQLSYDYLESEEAKSCFLLCSLFPEAEDIELEDLVRYVVGLELFNNLNNIEDVRGRVQNAVNILTSYGLLLKSKWDERTKMHDVVREAALLIGYVGKDKYSYLLKVGKDLIECPPRDNNVKDLTDYKKTNFDDFVGSYHSMIRTLDAKAPLRAVLKATNHYHDRNIIKDGRYGKVFNGKLRRNGHLMNIAVWRLDRQYRENYIDFKRELKFLIATFKHDNVSSIFDYFDGDEDGENIIIYEHSVHGILQGNLRNPALTWSRRLQICLGVARALNYIHDKGFIHCDVNSSKILLDEDWEPKVFGFELCTDYPQNWRHRLHSSRYTGTTSVMTPKYDVYMFGELLFEVLCEEKPTFGGEDGFNGKVDDKVIDPSLRKHRESRSMRSFINTANNCLDKKLEERPSMNQIVRNLERALELQREQENLERSTNRVEDASSNRLLMKYLEIPLIEIVLATKKFDPACIVGFGGFGTVHRAELNVLDIESVSSMKGKSKNELPRKSKTVAIKRLTKQGGEQAQKGFLTEIELLTSCKHPNVVSLLGFSTESNEMILVFEYASKGSLSDCLLGSGLCLSWSQRLQICLEVARGIHYLHNDMDGKPSIIHRDIKSDNILLDENLNAKVADFGLSTFHPTGGKQSTVLTKNVAGTEVYMDPEYRITGGYKKESDIYSFGVVLFEVLSGRLAYDHTYLREDSTGLAPIVQRRFKEGTLTELIDPKMFEEDDERTFTLNRGPTQESFNLFSEVGYECLAKSRAKRPKMEVVIKTLEKALEAQGRTMKLSRFQLSSIEDATHNFAKTYYVGSDTSGNKVYKAQLDHFAEEGNNNGHDETPKRRISVAIKHISGGRVDEQVEERFFSEIEMHTRNKHPDIVPLLGICYERENMLLVYEHAASEECLDDYLTDTDNMSKHTWIERLHQCLGIARGLNHLHTLMDQQGKQEVIHADIRSANILLARESRDEAKIAYFGFSKLLPPNHQEESNNNNVGTKFYCCPENYDHKTIVTGEPKKQSDVYSFGVVLFEIFCGRVAYDPVYTDQNENGLAPIARRCFKEGTIKEMIDPALKEESIEDILRIANQCLAENQAERPTMQIIIKQLEKALSIQNPEMVEEVHQNMKAQSKFYVNSLPREEAWILFKRVVGERVETDADLKPVAEKVAKECGGVPLLIQAVGYVLKQKPINSWKAALSQLKKPAPSELDPDIKKTFTCLQLTYDYLESKDAKLCFLLGSMYPKNCKIWYCDLAYYIVGLEKFDDLESMGDALRRVLIAVKILISSGLLLEADKKFAQMHDDVRDVGLLISSKSQNKFLMETGKGLKDQWPRNKSLESYKGISIIDSDIIKLPDYKVNVPNLDIFLCFYNPGLSKISDEFIQCIKNVKVIDISNNNISSLPQSFQLLTKLRTLDLSKNNDLCDISILGVLRDLEYLNIRVTGISEIPKEIAQLVNLRVLRASDCPYLSCIAQGVMSALSKLEELSIDLKWMDEGFDGCIAEVMKLSKITKLDLKLKSKDDEYEIEEEEDETEEEEDESEEEDD